MKQTVLVVRTSLRDFCARVKGQDWSGFEQPEDYYLSTIRDVIDGGWLLMSPPLQEHDEFFWYFSKFKVSL